MTQPQRKSNVSVVRVRDADKSEGAILDGKCSMDAPRELMMQTEPGHTFISEPLTWREICESYPDEWVCLVEIDAFNTNDFGFRTARVVGHGKDPRTPFSQARPLRERYPEMGHYFTGLARGPFPRFS